MTIEFNPKTCQWTAGCDHPVVEGKSYCEHHVWTIYQKGTAPGQRKKDKARAENTWNILSELELSYRDLVAEGAVEEA